MRTDIPGGRKRPARSRARCEYSRTRPTTLSSARRLAAALALALAAPGARPARAQQPADYRLPAEPGNPRWLLDPAAHAWLVQGLDRLHLTARPDEDLDAAATDQRSAQILAQLNQLGFNALGPDTDAEIWHRGRPFFVQLEISRHIEAEAGTEVPDVYDDAFAGRVNEIAAEAATPRSGDRDLIGYFSDSSLDWLTQPDAPVKLLDFYLHLPMAATGRQNALEFLRLRYQSNIRNLDRAWQIKARGFEEAQIAAVNPAIVADADRFLVQVTARYFQVAADAVRNADPNHLYFGAIFDPAALPAPAGAAPPAWAGLQPDDVLSLPLDPAADATGLLERLYTATDKPLLLVFRGCTPPGAAVMKMIAQPAVIGYLWQPGGDWESGPCATAASGWAPINQRAVAVHTGAPPQ